MKCPYCGADIQPTDLFCPSCKSPLPLTEQNSKPKPSQPGKTGTQKVHGSLGSVLTKKPVLKRVKRKLKSRRTLPTEKTDDAPDIQTFQEEYEKQYHIPTVGGFEASEIVSHHETPACVKPAALIAAAVLLVGGGTLTILRYTPLLRNIQARQQCDSLTTTEEKQIGDWNDLVAEAKPYLKLDAIEYSKQSIPEKLGKITEKSPKELQSCTANPTTYKKSTATTGLKVRELKEQFALTVKDHRKTVAQARKHALADSSAADKWMTSHQHDQVTDEQEELSEAIRAVRQGEWKSAQSWIIHDNDIQNRLTKLRNRIHELDRQKKQDQKSHSKPKQDSTPVPAQKAAPQVQQAPAPSSVPRTHVPPRQAPVPRRATPHVAPAPRHPAPEAKSSGPNNWNVPAPRQDEGRL